MLDAKLYKASTEMSTAIDFPSDIPLLYHYTNSGGFAGMLDSKSLWFTNIHDQNDTQEFRHGLQLIKEVFDEEYDGFVAGILDMEERYPIFTCSLTEKENLLSQWRGYCPGAGGGFCYSLDKQQLQSMIGRNRLMLAKCIYDKEEKKEFIRRYIMNCSPEQYNDAKKKVASGIKPEHLVDSSYQQHPAAMHMQGHFYFSKIRVIIRRNIANYASVMKHEAFAEEKEWRIVTYSHPYQPEGALVNNPNLIFTPRGGRLHRTIGSRDIEYIPFSLVNNYLEEVMVNKVIVGPAENKEKMIKECKVLMLKHGGDDKVFDSEIPYRGW